MTKKEIFIQEIGDYINNNDIQLSSEAIEYFEDLSKEKPKEKFTENGAKILKYLQENSENQIFKAKDIGEALSISGRSASGSMRKLISDGYVEKIGQNPVTYKITSLGIEVKIDK